MPLYVSRQSEMQPLIERGKVPRAVVVCSFERKVLRLYGNDLSD